VQHICNELFFIFFWFYFAGSCAAFFAFNAAGGTVFETFVG